MTLPGLTPQPAQQPSSANHIEVKKLNQDLYRLKITRTTEFPQHYEFYFTLKELNQLIGQLLNAADHCENNNNI